MREAPLTAVLGLLAGAPGLWAQEPGYFQQGVRYTIEARLDETAEVLHGRARVEYTNRSPDALDELYFHLYLNAFRPGSEWARAERRERFNFARLQDPDYGYERLRAARVSGADVVVSYPHAPDSTVVRLALPEALSPGGSVTVDLDWDARPSTVCRRQCRRGRHYDFAQWYPRIAVYDRFGWEAHPLYPQGEFYGEFATYDVTLEVADDQVLGATGVAVSGDPGWKTAPGSPSGTVDYQRDWYGADLPAEALGLHTGAPEPGRKRVRFHAEDIHHFGLTLSPDYRYDEAHYGDVVVRVLYRPDDLDWDLGAAARRTVRALRWLEGMLGPYPYPQLTNVHRLEGGGTEFPMMIMDGGPGQGLITHEGTHQYAHGILANNEWKEAWLDEGLTSFLTSWFTEDVGGVRNPWAGSIERLAAFEARNTQYPMSMASEEFPDFGFYNVMAYSKPSVMFFMLREYLGRDTMRRILREYYRRFRFRHVTGRDFQAVAEDVGGQDLAWFFDQWVRSTAKVDYGVQGATVADLGGGRFRVAVTVTRAGEGWMPVTLEVAGERRLLLSHDRLQVVEVETSRPPETVVLDPDTILLDADRANNTFHLDPGRP